jgi:hypothetical protein
MASRNTFRDSATIAIFEKGEVEARIDVEPQRIKPAQSQIGFKYMSERKLAEKHLDTNELATRWRMSATTLRNWRWIGKGPIALKLGSRVVYRVSDVEQFEQAALNVNTSCPGGAQ